MAYECVGHTTYMYVFVCPVVDLKISVGGSSCEIKGGQGQIKVGSVPLTHNA